MKFSRCTDVKWYLVVGGVTLYVADGPLSKSQIMLPSTNGAGMDADDDLLEVNTTTTYGPGRIVPDVLLGDDGRIEFISAQQVANWPDGDKALLRMGWRRAFGRLDYWRRIKEPRP